MVRVSKVVACVALLAACGACSDKKTEVDPSLAPAADAKKIDPATAATITGKVLLDGTPPANPVITMASDPACSGANNGADIRAESYVVDKGALQNVFVYIRDGLGNKYLYDTPTEPVKID